MPFLRSLLVAAGGALVVALGNVLGVLLEPILGFLALRGLQALAKVSKSPELEALYKQAVATYNARGGAYVEKAEAAVLPPSEPDVPADPAHPGK